MVLGLFKRKRFKKKNKASAEGKSQVPKVCGNCKHYRGINRNGIVGECHHDKAYHQVNTGRFDTYGKPIIYNMPLAVQPHSHCGMNCFDAR